MKYLKLGTVDIFRGISNSGISIDKTEANIGAFDYWLVKLNGEGEIEWQNTIGGEQTDYLSSAKQTADGGFIIAGYSYSGISGDKVESSNGSADYWVLKLMHPVKLNGRIRLVEIS